MPRSYALTQSVPADVDKEFDEALDAYCGELKDTMLENYDATGVKSHTFLDPPLDEKSYVDVQLGASEFTLEVARTADQQAHGLKGRERIMPFGGMLFEFDPPRNVIVTMEDVLLPLDVVFVDASGSVLEILRNLQPGKTLHRSKQPAAAMIEVAASFAQFVEEGDTIAVVKSYYSEDQARDDRGRWSTGAAGSGSEAGGMGRDSGVEGGAGRTSTGYTPPDDATQKVASDQLKESVQQMADLYAKTGVGTGISERDEEDVVSIPKFITMHGAVFPIGPDSYEGERCTAKQCYANAGREAISNDKVAYVEGYVQLGDKDGNPVAFPIEHAFLVDRESGYVVDPTLRVDSNVYKPVAYYGVPFKNDYVTKTAMKSKVWGLFGGWNSKLLTNPKVAEAAVDTSVKPAKTFAFDPNQERDDHGRWTGDGGGGVSADGRITLKDHSREEDLPIINRVLGGAHPGDVAETMVAGLPSDSKFDVQYRGVAGDRAYPERVSMIIKGDLFQARRTFSRDADGRLVVEHDSMEVNVSAQGHGIAKDFLRGSLEAYESLGVHSIVTQANIDVGGYAWARLGFKVDGRGAAGEWENNVYRLLRNKVIPRELSYKLVAYAQAADVWKLADARYGQVNVGREILQGTAWHGYINMGDKEQMTRVRSYVR